MMAGQFIKCPNCHFEIELTEVLTSQIRDSLRAELEQELKKKESLLEKLKADLDDKEKQLKEEKLSIEAQVKEKIQKELERIKAEAQKEALEKLNVELQDLKSQIDEKEKRIAEFNQMELELRKKMRKLEEDRMQMELEVARKIDEEREKIKEQMAQKIAEEYRLKNKEKDKMIEDLRKALEEAKRKAEQRSQQLQGEVLELELEEVLKNTFVYDEILPVPKGVKGADVIQKVYNSAHQMCGIILWETKSTKNWNDIWIQKLKDDQRALGADIAVIVTEAMPKEVDNLGVMNGVWVTTYKLVIGLATALRQNLIEVNFAKAASVGKSEKMEALYQYLSGPEFRQKVEAIVETFTLMQQQLEKEKRAMTKIWKEREKQIQRITVNTVEMYGDVRGIIGASLPEIKTLELGPVNEMKELNGGDE